ncbi:uncharacterized protein YaaR (DUF327 family) [Virgibacillus halotolerans]|uniref:YaaR family protein n=1 Tax=Virgibacillus halotolerans TaxID=1071053 RepID=UPI00195F3898|nr:YaaR family protein [Virgibacillus halotolerans]MBM7601319.1 uncharacterized protein YaaR (DUF327 family) [Virgibacillus halotolerans]
MKINQELRAQTEANFTRTPASEAQTFNKMVQSQTKHLKQQELQQLMKNITLQGNKLARFHTFRDLVKFKRMVKGFLQETVSSGLDLQKSNSFNIDGQNRNLALIKEVDEKLMALTEEIMNQEKKTVDLLGLIGEIKGLLINIYG